MPKNLKLFKIVFILRFWLLSLSVDEIEVFSKVWYSNDSGGVNNFILIIQF